MKRIALTLALLISVVWAQDSLYFKDEVVKVDGISSHELYKRAKLWLYSVYNAPKHVIQLDDSLNKILIVKASFSEQVNVPIHFCSFGNISESKEYIEYSIGVPYDMIIESRDNRYKLIMKPNEIELRTKGVYGSTYTYPFSTKNLLYSEYAPPKTFSKCWAQAHKMNQISRKQGYESFLTTLLSDFNSTALSLKSAMQKPTKSKDW